MKERWKFRYRMYKQLYERTQQIYSDVVRESERMGMTTEMRGQFGLTGGISGCPGLLVKEVSQAMEDGA